MGKTPANKRLTIIVYPGVAHWPEWGNLAEQGHTIKYVPETDAHADLIVGEVCWRLTEELRKYLPLAIKNARAGKKK